uniref:Uncharacterized protein n=1 Tax=Myoviridae sp. ctStS16 TaxID=2826654 RepID=A0A8S5QPG8_9CAUD|nr:MAG TPA: hypothetical protein [Myoviridae sp. ctStS16]
MGITHGNTHLYLFSPLKPIKPIKPINKAPKRHTTLFPIMQTGYYQKNTQFYLQQ